uniref:Uncharacterized protein n=1 Tax=viral metagenome TaxID=1070528 RepID=A0A6C0KUS3_9ZZZZ
MFPESIQKTHYISYTTSDESIFNKNPIRERMRSLKIILCMVLIAIAIYYFYHYKEGFENARMILSSDGTNPILEFAPDTPSPADVYDTQPYHLLSDIMAVPRTKESISCVNSRNCYATDFGRMIEKTGTFRQMTNNYKRNYPDSCTAPTQELVLNFYKTDPMSIPSNHTGKSVSFF